MSAWASTFNTMFGPELGPGGFDSEAAAVDFVEDGRNLVARLNTELGESWHVEYRPQPIRPPGVRLRSGGA